MEFLQKLRDAFADKWLQLSVNVHEKLRDETPTLLYGLLGATALAPVLVAPNPMVAFGQLSALLGGLGVETLGNLLEEMRTKKQDVARARLLEAAARNSHELRQAMDLLLEKMNALALAREAHAAKHPDEAAQAQFAETLKQSLAAINSRLQITVKVGRGGTAAVGKKAKALNRSVDLQGARTGDVHINIGDKRKRKGKKSPARRDLQHAYLNHMFESSRHLSLAGIDPKAASDAEARMNLDAVYTALLTQGSDEAEKMLARQREPEAPKRLTAVAQLDRQSRLVLLGDPGSGKTTFVNFVALCLAGELLDRDDANLKLLTAPLPPDDDEKEKEKKEKKENPPQPWRHGPLLPVHIILRDFAARGLPPTGETGCAKHLLDFLDRELDQHGLGDYAPHLRQHLMRDGGLVLFDGLDEVAEANARRVQIKQVVEDVAKTYGKCRIVVTSRVYAYQQQDWRLAGFAEARLAPFTRAQIRLFVEHWYAHIGALRRLAPADAEGRAEVLKRAIFGNPNLYGLAERPLLLTLMASLHAWRGGSLPDKREELYRETVELLLDWWEGQKVLRDNRGNVKAMQPSLAEWLKVDRQKVRTLLNRLAYEAHDKQPQEQTGTADIPEGDLVSGLMRLSQNPEVNPKKLVEYLSVRAGLLIARGEGVYTMPHRTFQEYLAACHLTDSDYPDTLADLVRADPNRWREVALLAGAKAAGGAQANIWHLAEALCPQAVDAASVAEADVWGAQIAGQALAETADLAQMSPRHQEKLTRVRDGLVFIVARSELPATERAVAGQSLARLGEPRHSITGADQMPFCLVPAGPFRMGGERYSDEKPRHTNEKLDYAYWMSQYPVSQAQFDLFVQDGGYQNEKLWPEAKAAGVWRDGQIKGRWDNAPRTGPQTFGEPFDLPNHPVVGVTWYETLAFVRWLERRWRFAGTLPQGWHVHLPSEAEWEKAARGGLRVPEAPMIGPISAIAAELERSGAKPKLIENTLSEREYPWGDEIAAERANYSDAGIGSTTALGAFPLGRSPYGCDELSGNVWEWTRSLWGKGWENPEFKYPYAPDDGRERLDAGRDVLRVLRGGAFNYNAGDLRAALRDGDFPYGHFRCYGFRVVLSPVTLDSEHSGL